jgi:hypothetical protein
MRIVAIGQVEYGRTASLGARADPSHSAAMTAPDNDKQPQPVMLPFRDKDGPGWHVVIRYHAGHERRIDGFGTEEEALKWIVENAEQVDE